MHITDENHNTDLDNLLSKVKINEPPTPNITIRQSEIDDAKKVDLDSINNKLAEQYRKEQREQMELEIKAETARVKAEILNKYKAEESAEAKRRAEYLRMAQAISKLRY